MSHLAPNDFASQLGVPAERIIEIRAGKTVDRTFTSSAEILEGTIVKITGDNTVEPVATVNDTPIGNVITCETKSDRIIITVQTKFQSIVRGVSVGAIVAGVEVNAIKPSATVHIMEYQTAAIAPAVPVGVALIGTADTEETWIGLWS